MFRSAVASSLVVVALFAVTGCGASATPATTNVASSKHDASWYPSEETEFAFSGDGDERAARPETAHNLDQPNRNEIPHGVIHAATN